MFEFILIISFAGHVFLVGIRVHGFLSMVVTCVFDESRWLQCNEFYLNALISVHSIRSSWHSLFLTRMNLNGHAFLGDHRRVKMSAAKESSAWMDEHEEIRVDLPLKCYTFNFNDFNLFQMPGQAIGIVDPYQMAASSKVPPYSVKEMMGRLRKCIIIIMQYPVTNQPIRLRGFGLNMRPLGIRNNFP